jgi:hypothetical protein
VKSQFNTLNNKVVTAEESINSDIEKQQLTFQELRKAKKKKQPKSEMLPIVIPVVSSGRRGSSLGRRGSKYDGLIESLSKH